MQTDLASIFKPEKILDIFKKKETSVIGIDIGSSSVKAVQLRKDKGRVILETYGEIATGPYGGALIGQSTNLTQEKLGELILDLFREANVDTKKASIAIPLKSSLVVNMKVPKMGSTDLASAIPIEARKYIPVPISEVALDWWLVPTTLPEGIGDESEKERANDNAEVLVAAIHKNILSQYEALSKSLALDTAFMEIEIFSSARSSVGNELSAIALVDLGAASSKMTIIDYGVLRMSHTINKGAQDLTTAISRSMNVDFAKAEEIKRKVGLVEGVNDLTISDVVSPTLETVFSEIQRVILDYERKNSRSIGKIIFVGGGSLLKGMYELAEKSFDAEVVIGKPFNKVETPAFIADILNSAGPSFSVAIGLALRHLQDV